MKSHSVLRIRFAIRSMIASIVQKTRNVFFKLKGYDIHSTVILERNLNLDRLFPQGIHVGKNTLIASGVTILSHDHCKRVNGLPLLADVYIGERCFIAVNATIMPGIHIGDEVVVGANAVVTKNVPPNSIVAGNPAKIIRSGVRMNDKAEIVNWDIDRGWF